MSTLFYLLKTLVLKGGHSQPKLHVNSLDFFPTSAITHLDKSRDVKSKRTVGLFMPAAKSLNDKPLNMFLQKKANQIM